MPKQTNTWVLPYQSLDDKFYWPPYCCWTWYDQQTHAEYKPPIRGTSTSTPGAEPTARQRPRFTLAFLGRTMANNVETDGYLSLRSQLESVETWPKKRTNMTQKALKPNSPIFCKNKSSPWSCAKVLSLTSPDLRFLEACEHFQALQQGRSTTPVLFEGKDLAGTCGKPMGWNNFWGVWRAPTTSS